MASSTELSSNLRARLNENGRVVIPAAIRQKLGLKAGETLLFSIEGDALRIETHRARIRRIQEEFKKYIKPGEMLMSDQLIADRREEALREMGEALG